MPNPPRTTVLSECGLHAKPILGWGRNFAWLVVKRLLDMRGWLEITPLENV
jgi:hypothetical protein